MNVHQPVEPEWTLEEENELFEIANLYPEDTGLPMTIWVSPKGNARHDARVKVSTVHGNRMTLDQLAVVAIRPEPRLVHGALIASDERLVTEWISKNRDALIAYWDGEIGTRKLMQRLVDL
ncbi:hypothetical protein HZ989_06875 [Brevundimonas sp. AJA228-03]|uniref:hypothetical protein n=1 Tax=Brevundimonas sp. AJA228-03 TaxID=2752515 RepID=UPI001AE08B1A|nr:hypothetical protein [Brevundimonas sp. AJA228-03]QTN20761.1 hypothetical protein HZ989_06875 [Brevundimonas sp. AJA228-03]